MALGVMVTVEGAVAADELLELSDTARPPAGAVTERAKLTLCAVLPGIVMLAGENLSAPATVTG